MTEEKDEGNVGAEVTAPKKPGRKRRRKKRNGVSAQGATCTPQVPPRHITNGRPAGESDSDSDTLHPLSCVCHECLWWQRPPGKDDDDPEHWAQEQLDKSRL